MTIEKVNQKVTYGPTIGPSGRSDINAVRQVEGLAVVGLRIGQNVNTLWNNPIQVCIAYFNSGSEISQIDEVEVDEEEVDEVEADEEVDEEDW